MPTIRLDDIPGLRVTIMGLGLNGGGLASARFFAERGAHVTVTDTKDQIALAESIEALRRYDIRYVLGRHDEADFSGADLVIKNPAVKPDNPYLRLARHVETDMSIFLRFCSSGIAAVTGSKGKSTTSTALAWMLNQSGIKAFLGGNITVSPLGFLDEAGPNDYVVLELSSWQLGDLAGMGVLKPHVAVMTRIVPDHLDRYGTMEAYVADKRLLYADQTAGDWMVHESDQPYGQSFASETKARTLGYGNVLAPNGFGLLVPDALDRPCMARLPGLEPVELVPARLRVPGAHTRRNLAAAALAAWTCGADPQDIAKAASSFTGIEHRLEPVRERRGVRWFNDSAATVPEAVRAAVESFAEPVVLITGGTDKQLDFEVARDAYRTADSIVLLAGSGTDKIRAILDRDGLEYHGPFDSLKQAVDMAAILAHPGCNVILSPGCTSFGMFKNEFDRGRSFKATISALDD